MKGILKISTSLITLAVAFLITSAVALAASVDIKVKDGLGSYLTDDKGMTLYMFKKDSAGTSACSGGCVEKWPLFFVENLTVPEGLKGEDFAFIKRDDGKLQTTYKGMPLYYFFKDKGAGDTNGQGVNNVWYIVAP